MTTRIVAGCIRDLSYVASNLRPEDVKEVECQFNAWSPSFLAAASLKDHCYVAEINGNPEAAFGAQSTSHVGLWVAWSWGTPRMWRTIPTITAFVKTVMIPDIIAQGCWRCEARAMAENTGAHRWLKRMGAYERCELPGWGKNGETFRLFEWLREQNVSTSSEDRPVPRQFREHASLACADS